MTLYTYQQAGVDWLVSRLASGGGAILADEMGLGKTAQALVAAERLGPDDVTVVCPASVLEVWRTEVATWAPSLLPRMEVVSWDRWKTRRGASGALLIADEAHYARTPSSARARALCASSAGYNARLLLTGTPVVSCVHNLWPLLRCVDPAGTPALHDYEERYCDPGVKRVYTGPGTIRLVRDVTGMSNASELRERLDRVMLRRRKADVLPQLPPFRRTRIPLPHSGRCLRATLDAVRGGDSIATARRREGEDKAQGAVEYVADLLESGERKVVVFGHHHTVLDVLRRGLGRHGVVTVDGRDSEAERRSVIARFQTSADVRVLVVGILACGAGVTLSAAARVVFVEFDWTPGVMLQAEQRVHRIGQKLPVTADWLVCPGTLDDHVFRLLARKLEQVDAMTSPAVGWREIVETRP